MTLMVTGSSGHLGEGLMRQLGALGKPAVGLDIKPSPFTGRVGSIVDRDFVRQCMKGVTAVIHAATLHKPHVATSSQQEFIDTNITGTLVLLEEAVAAGVRSFVFSSTTSTFGRALTPAPGQPAAWVTEQVMPVAKNIYGVSKLAAEGLCELFAARAELSVVVLRLARFFPEDDDDDSIRGRYETGNAQANELLYRRVDLEDVVNAHLLAVERAQSLSFGRFIIAATTPFAEEDLLDLHRSAPDVVRRYFPDYEAVFARHGWSMFPRIDRVYVNRAARAALGWEPRYDFGHVLDSLRGGKSFASSLAREVGIKGYHDRVFDHGPYPVS